MAKNRGKSRKTLAKERKRALRRKALKKAKEAEEKRLIYNERKAIEDERRSKEAMDKELWDKEVSMISEKRQKDYEKMMEDSAEIIKDEIIDRFKNTSTTHENEYVLEYIFDKAKKKNIPPRIRDVQMLEKLFSLFTGDQKRIKEYINKQINGYSEETEQGADRKYVLENILNRVDLYNYIPTETAKHNESVLRGYDKKPSRFPSEKLIRNLDEETQASAGAFFYAHKGEIIEFFTVENHPIKINMIINVNTITGAGVATIPFDYVKQLNNGEFIVINKADCVGNPSYLDKLFKEIVEKIDSKISVNGFATTRSDIRFMGIDSVILLKVEFNPLRGGNYVPTPEIFQHRKGLVNIHNEDNRCMHHCLVANKIIISKKEQNKPPINNPERKGCKIGYQDYFHFIKMENIEFPVDANTRTIKKIEMQNLDVSINIYVPIKNTPNIMQYYVTREIKQYHCDLLLVNDHYILISDFNAFMANDNHTQDFYCRTCLNKFKTIRELHIHQESCRILYDTNGTKFTSRIRLPKESTTMYFKNNINKFHMGLCAYSDAEAFNTIYKYLEEEEEKEKNKKKKRNTTILTQHKLSDIGYKLISEFKSIPERYVNFRVDKYEDPVTEYINSLKEIVTNASKRYNAVTSDKFLCKMTDMNNYIHHHTHICHICDKDFTIDPNILNSTSKKSLMMRKNLEPVEDVDLDGNYIGKAHRNCSKMRLLESKKLIVPFHNLSNYDAHLLIRKLAEHFHKINPIPKSMDKYLGFTCQELYLSYVKNGKVINKYRDVIIFKDTMNFINKSISFMAGQIAKEEKPLQKFNSSTGEMDDVTVLVEEDGEWVEEKVIIPQIEILKTNLPHTWKSLSYFSKGEINEEILDEQFMLLTQKGYYPYKRASDTSIFKLTLDEIPREEWYNDIDKEHITDQKWAHINKVYNLFNCQNFGDYHDIYLRTDILLMADIFERFRKASEKLHGLDPWHYWTLPSFSMDAGLKMSGIHLELFNCSQEDMYIFCEEGIRGGYSGVHHRYFKANTPGTKDFDGTTDVMEMSHIIYLDANNLYGVGMSSYLPTGGFKWVSNNFSRDDIMNLKHNQAKGYIFKVDLHYPEHLREKHNMFPLALHRSVVPNSWLSKTQMEMKRCNYHHPETDKDQEDKCEKLLQTFSDKTDYVVHYRVLQTYLRLGMELINVHKVLEFDQSPWLEPYITKNTTERAKTSNEVEKETYKLLNNSIYGKTMENVRMRTKVVLLTSKDPNMHDNICALRQKNTYHSEIHFSNDLVAVHLAKDTIVLNKPIYLGMVILDESKRTMYEFHYDVMLNIFDYRNMYLCMTDTDSLVYVIKGVANLDVLFSKDSPYSKQYFDCSEFPEGHKYKDDHNKKVIGMFKPEHAGNIIVEFCGNRAKSYILDIYDPIKKENYSSNRNKGVPGVVNKTLTMDDFRINVLSQNKNILRKDYHCIMPKNHNIYTMKTTKVVLNCADTKRYIHPDGITTSAFSPM